MLNNQIKNRIFQGHVIDVLKQFPLESVDCIVCSPPYFSQRFYGEENNIIWDADPICEHTWEEFTRPGNTWSTPGPGLYAGKGEYNKAWVKPQIQKSCTKCGAWYGQLGLEPTPTLFVKHLTDIFNECKRIMKPTGILFLNIGDTFAGSKSGYGLKEPNPKSLQSHFKGYLASSVMEPPASTCVGKEEWIKPKQLLMVPARLAISMQENGWILRRDIIWAKTSCLPSQVKDNFAGIYEHIFMFVKQGNYFFDHTKARKPYAKSSIMRFNYGQSLLGTHESGAKCTGAEKGDVPQVLLKPNPLGAMKGDIWTMNTANYKGAHFATFPEELVENCILPGCPREVCTICGQPKQEIYKMVLRKKEELSEIEQKKFDKILSMQIDEKLRKKLETKMLRKKILVGIEPMCKCKDNSYEPGIVMDPFAGAGTTLIVAKKHGYFYTGIELQPKYVSIIEGRLGSML